MRNKGYIKLHRQLQDCPMWYEERFSKGQAWVDLLLLANHSDKKILFNGDFIIIKRGQYLTSMVKLAEKWKWDRKTVNKFLKLLEKDKMITLTVDNTKTLINIDNYSIYQDQEDDGMDNPMDNPMDTNNNDKECIKNEKECNKNEGINVRAQEEPDLDEIWRKTYEAYPKKSYHNSAKEKWMNILLPVIEQNRKSVATMIWDSMMLFIKDYKLKNPDDSDFRYMPKMEKWLTEDLDYWMAEVERRKNDG